MNQANVVLLKFKHSGSLDVITAFSFLKVDSKINILIEKILEKVHANLTPRISKTTEVIYNVQARLNGFLTWGRHHFKNNLELSFVPNCPFKTSLPLYDLKPRFHFV